MAVAAGKDTDRQKSVCENPDLAPCGVEVVDEAAIQRLRVKEESYKAYIEEELSVTSKTSQRKFTKPDFGGTELQVTGAGIGDLANTFVRERKVVCSLGRHVCLLQERETTAEGVRMKGVLWITEDTSLVRCAVQHLRSFLESEKKIVQYRRHRCRQFPRPCWTFATQHVSCSHDTDRCS